MVPHLAIFDIETRLSPEIVGWDSARKGGAGISAIAIYDSLDDWLYLYDDHSISEAIHHLESADIAISWNGSGFDIPAIEGYAHKTIKFHQHWDIFTSFKKALGNKNIKGTGLGPTSERTIGLSKSGTGADAPSLAASGQFGKLFNYCAQDVRVLKLIVRHLLEHSYLIAPNGDKIPISVPSKLKGTQL